MNNHSINLLRLRIQPPSPTNQPTPCTTEGIQVTVTVHPSNARGSKTILHPATVLVILTRLHLHNL